VTGPVICVVGAGTAGLEALLAAREELGPDAELWLIAPERDFRYRPMSHDSLFRPAQERSLAIADFVAEAGATWVADRAEVVRQAERTVLTRDGDTVDFDFLLLAPGVRSKRALSQGYIWQRGGDPGFLDQIISDIRTGDARSVAVVVPRGVRWPVPAYELALVLAWAVRPTPAQVTLITAEEQPLGALGSAATEAVVRELDAAGIKVIAGVEVVDEPRRDGEPEHGGDPHVLAGVMLVAEQPGEPDALIGKPTDPATVRMGAGASAQFDRMISLPTVVGPFIAGVRTDAIGFVEVDETLKVCDSERVWAAGGCVAAALEHSALGARQADTAMAAIAAATGTGSASSSGPVELTGMILTGQRDRWAAENPAGTHEPSTRCLWWPPGRAVGRMLAKRIAAWDPSVQDALPRHPEGLVLRVPIALGCSGAAPAGPIDEVSADVKSARLLDIEHRQLMAVRRREQAAEAELRGLSARLRFLTDRQHEAVRELQQHGYLHDHP
jgi:sulfide:quinone oxidoreductase